eukprot:scaffold3873_cov177-Ochromonas_danica.AAC.1
MRRKVNKFMNSPLIQVFMSGILLLSLFLPDSWVLGNAPDSHNTALYSVLLSILVLFAIEMVILCFVQDGYFPNFYFWLDLIGTISVIFDIGWITHTFLPNGTSLAQTSLVRSTRAAKLGARYGRILRLLRLLRFLKFMPCFKALADDEFEPTLSAIKKVSSELSSALSIRTALLVLILVIVMPFLSYSTQDYSANAWITTAKMMAKNQTTTWYDIENLGRKVNNFYEPKDSALRKFKVECPWFPEPYRELYETRRVLRHSNIVKFGSSYYLTNTTLINSGNPNAKQYLANASANGRWDEQSGTVEFKVSLHLDQTTINQENSMYNIIIIIMVLVLLIFFTGSFTANVSKMVIEPLEKMMGALRNSAMLMIKSLKTVENAHGEHKSENSDDGEKKDQDDTETADFDDEAMETAMLEEMVARLARIVQHIVPNHAPIATDSNIDKHTANWLNQSYATGVKLRSLDVHRTDSALMGDEQAVLLRLAKLEKNLPTQVVHQLNTWAFNVLDKDVDLLDKVVHYLFSKMHLLEEFKVPEDVFMNFLKAIGGRYLNNVYHNYKHGVDVCYTCHRLMFVPGLNTAFSLLEVFSVLVGALAHDVGHPGVNNSFLVKTQHQLAIQHNDRSPLENMHCVTLYEVLGNPETAIFANLDKKQKIESRAIILTIILGTDMAHHFEQIQKTQLFLEVNGADTKAFCSGQKDFIDCFREDKHRLFIMELVLHCSDISNPFKPYDLCAKWADLVVEEFCQQGDKERELGLEISPMCDRTNINLANMQMGFIEFVVAPLVIAFVNIFPPLHEIGSNMLNNFKQWGDKRKMEIDSDSSMDTAKKAEEARKLDDRIGKFTEKLAFTQQYKIMPFRRRGSGSTIA